MNEAPKPKRGSTSHPGRGDASHRSYRWASGHALCAGSAARPRPASGTSKVLRQSQDRLDTVSDAEGEAMNAVQLLL